MTEAEFIAVETELAVELPGHYREFLLAYPQALIDKKLDLGWVQESPAERKLLNNPARLIELNRDVRRPGTPWVGEVGDPWPDHYFVIGDDQCGNYWAIDLHSEDPEVWFYDHDLGTFDLQHASLGEFGESLLAEIEEFNRENGRA